MRTLNIWSSIALVSVGLLVPSVARAEVVLPDGTKVAKVDFERHIMGLFSKSGCNSGSCHGSFQGKNGFRLSLFGFEPDRDFNALTRDILGRRIDPNAPDDSLLLRKATGTMRHDGAVKFSTDSWQYKIFREWIAEGAPRRKGSGEVASVRLEPREYVFARPGSTSAIKAIATFVGGDTEDITPFCDFRVQDDAVATVDAFGKISAVRPGDTGLVVSYRGQVQAVRVLVPTPLARGFVYPKLQPTNLVDREVYAKLRQLNVVPSEPASDAEFLRRASLDTIGMLPTPDEVRAFLADADGDKRAKKVAGLLAHPLHAAIWATKLSDVTGNNTDALENAQSTKSIRSQMWHDWLRKRLADNTPWDRTVRGIVTATTADGLPAQDAFDRLKKLDEVLVKKSFETAVYAEKPTLDLFWRRQAAVPVDQWGEKVAAAFLGVRLECAQCHKHPTDRWTQTDYRSWANFFAQVNFGGGKGATAYSSPELAKLVIAFNEDKTKPVEGKPKNNNQIDILREMFVVAEPNTKSLMTEPETGAILKPKTLGGPTIPFVKGKDVRGPLADWLVSPENPFFARSFVNRMWAHYFGVGLVDPVDDFSLANPPSNARLLEALAQEFVKSGYDIRHMETLILSSRVYQQSSKPNATNKFDRNNYARSYVRPMMAEVMLDVMNDALGTQEAFGADAPAGRRMSEIGASKMTNANVGYILRIFGRPLRTTACDCERATEPALPQTLYRMTDPNLLIKLNNPQNRFRKLVASKATDDEILDEMFLATLTRLPSAGEKAAFVATKDKSKDRLSAFTDMAWALINTREFVLNH